MSDQPAYDFNFSEFTIGDFMVYLNFSKHPTEMILPLLGIIQKCTNTNVVALHASQTGALIRAFSTAVTEESGEWTNRK